MQQPRRNYLILLGFIVLLLLGLSIWRSNAKDPTTVTQATPTASPSSEPTAVASAPTYKRMQAKDIVQVPAAYQYSVEVPTAWQVELNKEAEAVNFYDPTASGVTNLDKSQIFIRYFRANSFLTLSTVTVLERTEQTILGRPAVRYIIEKKPNVPAFPNQPAWRNERHIVTDIRVSDTNPSIFYVIAKRPSLSDDVYEHFLSSIEL